MENIYWKRTVSILIGSIWLYTLAGIAGNIVGAVNSWLNPVSVMQTIREMMSKDTSSAITSNAGDVLEMFCSFLVLAGYFLFFRSLSRFVKLQRNEADKENVGKIRQGYLMILVAFVADFIPMFGWFVKLILLIFAYIQLLSGYKHLKKSFILPSEVREGFTQLYTCTIWTLAAFFIGCIPIIGSLIEGVISFILFFIILKAWGKIKRGAPEVSGEEAVAINSSEPPYHVRMLGDCLIVYFLLEVLSSVAFIGFLDIVQQELPGSCSDILYLISRSLPFFVFSLDVLLLGWMLCSRGLRLGKWSKIGLSVLLVKTIVTPILLGMGHVIILPISDGVSAIGMLLFIAGTCTSRGLKIIVGLYYPVITLWRCYVWIPFFLRDGRSLEWFEIHQTVSSALMIFNMGFLVIIIPYFVLVRWMVKKWKEKFIGAPILP